METPPILAGLVVGTLAFLFVWRPWAREVSERTVAIGASLAVAIASIAGAWTIGGRLPFVPTKALHWLLWFGLSTAPIAWVHLRAGAAVGIALWTAAFGALLWRVMPAVVEYEEWEPSVERLWYVGLVGAALVVRLTLARLAGRTRAGETAGFEGLHLLLWAAGATVALGTTSGESALTLAAVCCVVGASMVAGFWRRDRPMWSAGSGAVAYVVLGLLVIGTFYASLPRVATGVLAGALVPAALASWLPGALGKPWLRLVVTAAMIGVGIWLAQPEPDPYGYGY